MLVVGECQVLLVAWFPVLFFQAEDGIRDLVRSRGLGDVYKRQVLRARGQQVADHVSHHNPRLAVGDLDGVHPGYLAVSYTHLTLPTIYPV